MHSHQPFRWIYTDFKGGVLQSEMTSHWPRWSHHLKSLLLGLLLFEPPGKTAFPIQEYLATRLPLVRAFI